jgi:hypothetical protein
LRVGKATKANEGCFTVKAVNEAGVATSTCVVVVNDVVEPPKAAPEKTKPAFYVPLKNQVGYRQGFIVLSSDDHLAIIVSYLIF